MTTEEWIGIRMVSLQARVICVFSSSSSMYWLFLGLVLEMVGWVLTVLLHRLLVGSIVLCARPYELMLQECAVQRLFIGAPQELPRCITVRVKITWFCSSLKNEKILIYWQVVYFQMKSSDTRGHCA